MKKITTLLFTALFALVAYSTAEAQFKLGAGLSYGTGVLDGSNVDDWQNDLGINVDAIYSISESIRAGASFTYFLPKDESGLKVTVWELAANGNYVFLNQDELMVYGLAGLAFTGVSADNGGDESETVIGLNLGAGLEKMLNFGDLFAEAKMANIGGDGDDFELKSQFVISAGVRFPLGN